MQGTIGLIGTGMLGEAIARGWLDAGLPPERLLFANRSGKAPLPGIEVTTPGDLARRCETILLCIPPAALPGLDLAAPDALVLSVIAGATRARLQETTGSPRVIRAMSSPAAARRLAYTPWIGSAAITEADRTQANAVFSAIGRTDEIGDEAHIDLFTALTGPVPGFAALFASAMARHAVSQGVPPDIADRAVRQLFLSAGEMLAHDAHTADAHVEGMIAYAGTTAAGFLSMRAAGLEEIVANGLQAATDRARDIG
ncbi:pyrroline-5-carboxylate reductase family protein [Sagittula stellata]|uniref:Pyrroline-5-carboxylate reductase n=1 Tax=Sagittula stellata (strain ATCC 700073 / DSM 11524 / E-37) TaxID=388399 RepID=A3K0L9_SAGS3|nr:pyrroline-5-carboxylate reductase dimerization domain-containing protein [Sagittula stellata]EBA09334.1 putative pyrroline-5-carboxylate reductase protein [Sagittula stellata E-37]